MTMIKKLKKVVIPITEASESLFPFSRSVPRELLPVGDYPLIQHIVDEAVESDADEIVFVLPSSGKVVVNHFKDIDKVSDKEKGFKDRYSPISFSYLLQKKKTESGYTISKTEKKMEGEPFAVSFPDTIFYGKKPGIDQLFSAYRTSEKPVVALKEVDDKEVASSLIVETEKIANRLYKIRKIHNCPSPEETSSRLALAGRYILTSLVFDHLKKMREDAKIADALNSIISSGKIVYGNQLDGSWFSCNDVPSYLKTNAFFMAENSYFSNDLKKYFKEIL